MAQYDPIVIKSGLAGVLGTDTLRADVIAHAGLTTTGLASGDVVQVTANLTLAKAANTSTSPIVGIYDGVSGSVVREGVVVATFKTGPTANGEAVYLSSTAGQLTNVKPTADMLHEVGIVVDVASKKVLLQQKPVIALPATPPAYLWTTGSGRVAHQTLVSTGAYVNRIETPDLGGSSIGKPVFDGTNIWVVTESDPGRIFKINATTLALSGPFYVGRYGGLAFDGAYIWTASSFVNNKYIYKLNLDGSIAATYDTPLAESWCGGLICYDGVDSIWLSTTNRYRVYKMRVSDGAYLGYTDINGYCTGMCSTKTHLWASYASGIHKIRLSDRVIVGTYANGGTSGTTPCYDGVRIWQPVCRQGFMRRWTESDGTDLGTVYTGSDSNARIAVFTGAHVWVWHLYSLGIDYGWHKFVAATGAYVGTYRGSTEANNFVWGCSTSHVLPNLP